MMKTKTKNKLTVKSNRQLWLITILPMFKIFLFSVLPMIWLIMAFQFYIPRYGIVYSPFIGFENFMYLFKSVELYRILRNAIILNVCNIFVTTFFNILFALLMFEITNKFFLRFTQSIFYIPYFLSWPIVGIILTSLINPNGIITNLIASVSGNKISFYTEPKYWRFILVFITIWKNCGVGAIINYCMLLGVDASLYEAADLDGAGRWRKMWVVSLAQMRNMIVVGIISAFASLIRYDFGQIYFLTNGAPQLYETVDVVETYLFRALRKNGDYSISTAIGLFQGLVGIVLSIVTNQISRKVVSEESALF